jgi:hypothetical protein
MNMKTGIKVAGMMVAYILAQGAMGQEVLWTRGSNIYAFDSGVANQELQSWLPPKDLGLVRDLVANGCQALAILQDGSLRAWGPAGVTTPTDLGPVRMVLACWTGSQGCYGDFYAVLATGQVRTWSPGSHRSVTFEPAGLGTVKKIGGSWEPRVALRMDGTVWSSINVPGVHELRSCVDVASNSVAAMAVRADGSVFVWGSDHCGGWFPGADPNDCYATLTANIVTPIPVVSVTSGDYGFATIDASGHVVRYGRNYFGCQCPTVVQDWQPPSKCEPEQFRSVSLRSFQPFYGDFYGLLADGRVQLRLSSCDPKSFFEIDSVHPQNIVPVTPGVTLGLYTPIADQDEDGIADHVDNCPLTENPLQDNSDHDNFGDACDQAVVDCDQDNLEDALAIASGRVTDVNVNGVPDLCDCLGDVNGDYVVDGADIGAVLAAWGSTPRDARVDPNRDESVDGADLGFVLSQWGPCIH